MYFAVWVMILVGMFLARMNNGMDIDVVLAKSSPIGVDTKDDYEKVKKLLE